MNWKMEPLPTPCYIFSVETEYRTLSDIGLMKVFREMERTRFLIGEGFYKGRKEIAFITQDWEVAKRLGKRYEQESVLYVDENSYGHFVKPNDVNENADYPQSNIRMVKVDNADGLEGYTKLNGQIYTLI